MRELEDMNNFLQADIIRVDTLDEQVTRAYSQYQSRESDLLKNSFLQSLKCEFSPP
jgi:hypothetical protein